MRRVRLFFFFFSRFSFVIPFTFTFCLHASKFSIALFDFALIQPRFSRYMLPVTYATFSALFGTFSVVQAKVLSELVTLQLEGSSNIFWGSDAWFTYVTLVAWLAFVGVWLFRMNEALSLYDPLFIIPLLQVNFILFAIVSGKSP